MIYDEESVIADLVGLLQSDLNAEINLINTEKGAVSGDPLFLSEIPNDKYIFESLNKTILNYKGFFIMYGLKENPPREQQEVNMIEDVTVTVEISTFDSGTKNMNNLFTKLLRYRRALKSLVMKNPEMFRSYAKPFVQSLKPAAFPYSKNVVILSIGLDIRASISTF